MVFVEYLLLFITNNQSEWGQDYPHLHFEFHVLKKLKLNLNGKGLRQAYSLQHTWKIQVMSS